MRRPPFRRPRQPRATGPKFLIACEGDSEEAYLKAIGQDLRLPNDSFLVFNERGTDPLTIVKTVIKQREGLRKDGWWLPQDSAWAVFDGDEHRDNNPENWHRALNLAQANSVEVALSNPSLELWYLLHFQDQQAYLHRDKAVDELKKHIPHYRKPMILYPGPPGALHSALQRADRLARRNQETEMPFHNNPCSGMGRLVTLLLQRRK
jgi:hypothetical protein